MMFEQWCGMEREASRKTSARNSVVSTVGSLNLNEADRIWVLFNCFAVVLHVD